jgi:hypothetical protein
MRLTAFGLPDGTLAEALRAEDFELDARTLNPGDGASPADALAAALRDAEAALEDPPEAALVAGEGDSALAAAVTAVKLGIPTAWVGADGGEIPLVARVAELRLDATADAAQSARAVRELVESRIS